MSILFIGCSSDDSGSLPINEENLLGRWYFKGSTLDNGPFESYQDDCPASKNYMEILNTHDLKYYTHGTDCILSLVSSHTWTLNENHFTTVRHDPTVTAPNFFTILKITEEELVLKIDTYPVSPAQKETYKYYYIKN